MSDFGKILKATIEAKGVTQKWVAIEADTSTANINRYVKGTNDPDVLVILPRIAKALGVSADFLLGLTQNPSAYGLTPEEQALLSCFNRASCDDRETIYVLLRKYMTPDEREAFLKIEQESKAVG